MRSLSKRASRLLGMFLAVVLTVGMFPAAALAEVRASDAVTGKTFTEVSSLTNGQYVLVSDGVALDLTEDEYDKSTDNYKYYGFAGKEVTVSGGKITSTVYEDMIWEIESVSGGYRIKNTAADGDAVYLSGSYTSGNNGAEGVLELSANATVWSYSDGEFSTTIGRSERCISNKDSSNRFEFFTMRSSGSTFTLFKVENASGSDQNPGEGDADDGDALNPVTVSIESDKNGTSKSATIQVGQTLVIELTNGSSSSKDYTIEVKDSGIAEVASDNSPTLGGDATDEVEVIGLKAGETDIVMSAPSNGGGNYTATINLTVTGSGSGNGNQGGGDADTPSDGYAKVENVATGKYVIVVGGEYALTNVTGTQDGTPSSQTNAYAGLKSSKVTISGNKVTAGTDSTMVWTVTRNSDGKLTIQDASGKYLTANYGGSSGNNIRTLLLGETADANWEYSTKNNKTVLNNTAQNASQTGNSNGCYLYLTDTDTNTVSVRSQGSNYTNAAEVEFYYVGEAGGTTPDAPVVPSGDKVVVIAGSDYQDSNAGNTMTSLMNKIKGDYPSSVYGILMGGDYSSGNTKASDIEGVNNVISGVFPGIASGNRIFVQGNHDGKNFGKLTPSTSLLTATGAHDTKYYGVYSINDDDFGSSSSVTGLESYLDAKVQEGYTKPIFVVSHKPLHKSSRNDNTSAVSYFNAMNEAGEAGLTIVYLFGHNHSSTYDDYLGGGSIYLKQNDSMMVAGGSTESLNFIYMNYGYVGYCRNTPDNTLTMTAFEITDNNLVIKRYDTSGLHVLKAAGKGTSGYTANTTVYQSPQTIALNGSVTPPIEPDEPDTPDTPEGSYIYELDTDGIDAGAKYLIVAEDDPKALSAAAGSNNAVNVTFDGNYASVSSDAYDWVFTASGSRYTIQKDGTYLGRSNTDLAAGDSSTVWSVAETSTDGAYRITQSSGRSYYLRWSDSNTKFQAGTSQNSVRLYKLVETEEHKHTWADEYTQVNGQHYKECTAADCDEKTAEGTCAGGTATCTSKAKCEVCDAEYGDKNASNHVGGTEVKGKKAPTCSEDGYTGDTWCLGCETMIEEGAVDPATGKHDFEYGICGECGANDPNYVAPAPDQFIIVSRDYVMTTDEGEPYSNNGSSSSQKYNYTGFAGVTYDEDMDITADMVFELEDTHDGFFYIKHGDLYLNGSYVDNNSGGKDGSLTLGAKGDKWSWDGDRLKSSASGKYLTCGNDGKGSTFSVRSSSNYNTLVELIEVEVIACSHTGGTATCKDKAVCTTCGEAYGSVDASNHVGGTEVKGKKAPTCSEDGYTGDTWCLGCETMIEEGAVDPATGAHVDADGKWESDGTQHYYTCGCGEEFGAADHSGGTATCTSKAKCEACDAEYGDKNASNHVGGTEVRDAVEATCGAAGYTGDTYCLGCGVKTVTGQATDATGAHSGGTATCCELAVCANCGAEYGELDATNHNGETELRDATDATCGEAGYTGDTYCLGCETVVEEGEVIPATGNHGYEDGFCTECGAEDPDNGAIWRLAYEVEEATYTGAAQQPVLTIKDGAKVLVEGKDYVISSKAQAEVGTYDFIVQGIGDYKSEATGEWTIAPADIASVDGLVIADRFVTTGSSIKPTLTLSYSGALLVKNVDYTVAYDDNVYPGTATVIVTGLGNFTGTTEVSFEILPKGEWAKDPNGWKYMNSEGDYVVNAWQEIGGVRYYFDAEGYMQTGWLKLDGNWYYLKSSGAMAVSEWEEVSGSWYHFAENGTMQTGWLNDGGSWYYLKSSGKMAVSEWVKVEGAWHHFASDGTMETGWLKDAGSWYYLKANGKMASSEWVKVDGDWYYFNGSGVMQTSKWIGDYYVLSSGKMATSQWVGSYYVGANGKWIPNYRTA